MTGPKEPVAPEYAHLNWVQPEEVKELVGDEGTVVLDVRGEDFAGGAIKGAVNQASETFGDDAVVDALIQEHLAQASRVVVHCGESKRRGPSCALRVIERLAAAQQAGGASKPEVLVMEGGIKKFKEQYASAEPELFEGLQEGGEQPPSSAHH